jgi:hypothetical protein
LPLPARHIGEDFKVTMNDDDLHAYHSRVFHPLSHDHIFPDFPAFLRQAADIVESRSARAAAGAEGVTDPGSDDPNKPSGRGRVRAR